MYPALSTAAKMPLPRNLRGTIRQSLFQTESAITSAQLPQIAVCYRQIQKQQVERPSLANASQRQYLDSGEVWTSDDFLGVKQPLPDFRRGNQHR